MEGGRGGKDLCREGFRRLLRRCCRMRGLVFGRSRLRCSWVVFA